MIQLQKPQIYKKGIMVRPHPRHGKVYRCLNCGKDYLEAYMCEVCVYLGCNKDE